MPTKVLELELSEEVRPLWGLDGYDSLFVLVRYQGQPVGQTSLHGLRGSMVSAERLRETITDQMSWALLPIVLGKQFRNGALSPNPSRPLSVVVCTRNRTEQLQRCLQALLSLEYPDYEVLVVDNAPSNDETARLVACLPVRYVREARPGLDWARNRGIAEASHDVIAFTDDDARPDRLWLRAIGFAFSEPEVMALTGLVLPAELETPAQSLFEFVYGGMGKGFRRRVFRQGMVSPQDSLWASGFGVGANMAFRRELFTAIGSFDVALDVGTPSGGGGDVEMFHRVVARGYTLVYEPAAVVWHTHRRDDASLRRQLYDNGRSFGSYLLTCARNRTVEKRAILHFALSSWLSGWLLRRLWRPGRCPRHLVAIELLGALVSPLAYKTARVQARRLTAAAPHLMTGAESGLR